MTRHFAAIALGAIALGVIALGVIAASVAIVGGTRRAPPASEGTAAAPRTPADAPAGAIPTGRFLNPIPAPTAAPPTDALAHAADCSEPHAGRTMLVMKDGQVIFERYARGLTAERPNPLASGTKGFAGITAAAAVTDGLVSLDEYMADTIAEWKSDPRASTITARHLLSLTSGLEPNSELLGRQGYGIRDLGRVNNLAGALRGGAAERARGNWYSTAVKIPVTRDPGTAFRYGASHFDAWGEFLTRKLAVSGRVERSYWQYMRARVLQPAGIDISKSRLARDRAGNPNLPSGAHSQRASGRHLGSVCGADARCATRTASS